MKPADLDRLARAVHLDAERLDSGAWRVTGGARVHEVSADATACDCTDCSVRGGLCKHLLAVRLYSGDANTLVALRELVALPKRAKRGTATTSRPATR